MTTVVNRRPSPFRLSEGAACLNESMLSDPQWIRWWKTQPSIEVEVTDHMKPETFTRIVAPIEIQERRLFADKATGTLYSALTGRCLTANLRSMVVPDWDGDWPEAGPLKSFGEERM